MRYFIPLALLLLSACTTFLAPTPTPNAPTSARATPTTGAIVAPTSPPATEVVAGSPAAPTAPLPTVQPALAAFAADLRPEDANDLALTPSAKVYRMDLTFTPALDAMTGKESVDYTNATGGPLSEIYFRLFANYPDGGDKISVSGVQVNGAAAQTTLEGQDTALKVPLAQPLAPGSAVRLDLSFDLTIPISHTQHYADFTNTEGIVTLPSIYPLIPAHDDKGWHLEVPPDYGDLVYADTSFYDVRITAPTTTTVIASGSAVESTAQGANTTWHYIGAPMRDFSIMASAALQKTTVQVGDVAVNSYYLTKDQAAGTRVATIASDALADYEKRIGPYPFKELDVVETPTTAGGIEYPGLIVITDKLYGDQADNGALEFTVAHEVAHQWWYSQVGDDQVNTPWMDESFVQYTTLIYEEDKYGAGLASQLRQIIFQRQYDEALKKNTDLPIGLPVAAYNEEQYVEIVYGKGPLFFEALRKQIGDDNYFKFVQTYYQRYKYKVARPEDLKRTVEEVSGQNIDALYNKWVLGQ